MHSSCLVVFPHSLEWETKKVTTSSKYVVEALRLVTFIVGLFCWANSWGTPKSVSLSLLGFSYSLKEDSLNFLLRGFYIQHSKCIRSPNFSDFTMIFTCSVVFGKTQSRDIVHPAQRINL